MNNEEHNRSLNRRRFLQASGAAGATVTAANVTAAKEQNQCHFAEIGIDSEVIVPDEANYTPVYAHDDVFKSYRKPNRMLVLPDRAAPRLKKLAKNSNRVVDAAQYERFPGTVKSSPDTRYIPIATSPDLRPTKVLELDSKYQPPTVDLETTEAKISATVRGSSFDVEAQSKRAVSLDSFESSITVAKRENDALEKFETDLEIRPELRIRNHGTLDVVE